MVSTAVAVLVAVTALPLAAAATTNTTYPLFAIANNPVAADWTLADIVGTARDFTLADGVPVDAGLLSQLNQVSPTFNAVRYCNPRGISLAGPVADPGVVMPLEEFESHHRREALFYTAGFVAADSTGVLSADSPVITMTHPLAHGGENGENRRTNHCSLRDWLLVRSDPRSGNLTTSIPPIPSSVPGASSGAAAGGVDHAGSSGKKRGEVAFVAYLLVGQELMKISAITGDASRPSTAPPFDKDPPPPAKITVQRGL